jgi:hypothetical protein
LKSLDDHNQVVLVLLDLTAAFDTIDHKILLNRLEKRFGITGNALKWFTSYLQDRTQVVCVKSGMSESTKLVCGVPQGSGLGPILFTLYASPIEDIILKHSLDLMLYADDTQIYLSCKNAIQSVISIENCVDDIRKWMFENRLVLNDGKTELIHFKSKFRNSNSLSNIQVGDITVDSSQSVRNLGLYMDQHCTMSQHVSNTCRSASFALHRIGKIRNILDSTSTERLIHAFVTSRLDYCNSLLYGINDKHISRLQILQNSAARLVTRTRKYEHITPVRRDLHWLPITARIEFKILTLVFRILTNQAPSYLSELVTVHVPARATRSASEARLEPGRYFQKTFGARAFYHVGPKLWNDLPHTIRLAPSLSSFKTALKTHLFHQHYA